MTITASDLNDYVVSGYSDMADARERQPFGTHHYLVFDGIDDSIAAHRRKSTIVVPRSCFLETLAVSKYDPSTTPGMTITVSVTGDGALANWPLEVSLFTASTPYEHFTRTFYDNSYSKYGDRAFRVFPQGSTLQVSVSNDSGDAVNLGVCFVLRQFYGR